MKIRFFGRPGCKDCLKTFVLLNRFQIDYSYIDTDEDDVQDFCDDHDVDELPHIQFLDDNDNIIVTHIGSISEPLFEAYLMKYFSDY
jgi:glutaredoxin